MLSWATMRPMKPYSEDLRTRVVRAVHSKIKGILRKVEARSREALIEAMGKAHDAITSQDVEGFFRHFGHRSAGQLL